MKDSLDAQVTSTDPKVQTLSQLLMRTLKIGAVISLPVSLALLLGVGIGFYLEGASSGTSPGQVSIKEDLRIQGQMAADQLEAEIRLLQLEASHPEWAMDSVKSPGLPPEGIVLKAEVEMGSSGKAQVKWKTQSPRWVPTRYFNTDTLLESVLVTALGTPGQINQSNGRTAIFLKGDTGGGEWIAFLFKKPDVAGTYFLAVVDPSSYFVVFNRWHLHGGNGKYRGYLLSSNGSVLSHSQKSLAGADLHKLTLFEEVKPLFKGQLKLVQGQTTSVDHQQVERVAMLIEDFPLVISVEASLPKVSASVVKKGILFLGFFVLWSTLWLCASFLRKRLLVLSQEFKPPVSVVKVPLPVAVFNPPPVENVQEEGFYEENIKPNPPKNSEFFSELDFLILGTPRKAPDGSSSDLTSLGSTVQPRNEEH
ncbi:MAG: hypothetical protein HYX41_00860 [Bdellovibrio sp.]|nr:hypothetical protein [Bdellovibrio sp.]